MLFVMRLNFLRIIYPYNTLIGDKQNGFLYKEPSEILTYLEHLYMQRQLVEMVGRAAGEDVRTRFNYTTENIEILTDLFNTPETENE